MTSSKLESFLRSWHATSRKTQTDAGKRFELTYEDFLALWSPKQIAELEKRIDAGSLYMWLNSKNLDAYVLSWKSYADSQGEVMNKDTACIVKRRASFKMCRIGKGDKHSEKSKELISFKLTGKSKPDQHKAKIASSMLGVHVGRTGTEEESKRKSEAAKARWARVRAEKAAAKGEAE